MNPRLLPVLLCTLTACGATPRGELAGEAVAPPSWLVDAREFLGGQVRAADGSALVLTTPEGVSHRLAPLPEPGDDTRCVELGAAAWGWPIDGTRGRWLALGAAATVLTPRGGCWIATPLLSPAPERVASSYVGDLADRTLPLAVGGLALEVGLADATLVSGAARLDWPGPTAEDERLALRDWRGEGGVAARREVVVHAAGPEADLVAVRTSEAGAGDPSEIGGAVETTRDFTWELARRAGAWLTRAFTLTLTSAFGGDGARGKTTATFALARIVGAGATLVGHHAALLDTAGGQYGERTELFTLSRWALVDGDAPRALMALTPLGDVPLDEDTFPPEPALGPPSGTLVTVTDEVARAQAGPCHLGLSVATLEVSCRGASATIALIDPGLADDEHATLTWWEPAPGFLLMRAEASAVTTSLEDEDGDGDGNPDPLEQTRSQHVRRAVIVSTTTGRVVPLSSVLAQQ